MVTEPEKDVKSKELNFAQHSHEKAMANIPFLHVWDGICIARRKILLKNGFQNKIYLTLWLKCNNYRGMMATVRNFKHRKGTRKDKQTDEKAEYMASEDTGRMPSHGSSGSEDRKQASETLSAPSSFPRLTLAVQGTTLGMNWPRTGNSPPPTHSILAPWPPDSATSQMSAQSWNACSPRQLHSEGTGHSCVSLLRLFLGNLFHSHRSNA